MSADERNSNIVVEITDPSEFHCFRLVLNPNSDTGAHIEVMFHARSLVDLIHKCNVALSDWQKDRTDYLLGILTRKTEENVMTDQHTDKVTIEGGVIHLPAEFREVATLANRAGLEGYVISDMDFGLDTGAVSMGKVPEDLPVRFRIDYRKEKS